MDVYNLILERGYIGALDYANKIEHKNLRLASEIDEIVSELFRMASGVKSIRTAQTAMPRFQSYTIPQSNVPVQQSGGSIPSNKMDYSKTRPQEMPKPTGVGDTAAFLAKIAYLTRGLKQAYVIKSALKAGEITAEQAKLFTKNPVEYGKWFAENKSASGFAKYFSSWLEKGVLEKSFSGKQIKAIEESMKSLGVSDDIINQLKSTLKLSPDAAKAGEVAGEVAGAAAKDGSAVAKILAEASAKFGFLKPITEFIGKSAKFLGPIALAFDAYDIFTDIENDGYSARVVCKIVSALLGLGSLFSGPAAPILAALWLAGSLGCGLIPGGKKEQNQYETLNQQEINKAESTVEIGNLTQSDQNTVKELFRNNTERKDLMNNVRNLKDTKAFEKPAEALAFIQKHLKENNGQVVPVN